MNTIKRLSIVAVSSATLGLLASSPVSAEVGKILFVNGAVSIISPNGQSRPAARGEVLKAGERVVTAKGAMSQVKMLDGGRVGVRELSRVKFEPRQSGKQGLGLDTGAVRVVNVQTRGVVPPKMVVKTPDGQMDLQRGDALAAHNKQSDPAGKPETVVKLLRGQGVARHITGGKKRMKAAEVSAFKRGAPGFERRKPDLMARFEGPVPRKPGSARGATGKFKDGKNRKRVGNKVVRINPITSPTGKRRTSLKQAKTPQAGRKVASLARSGLKPVMPASRLKPTVKSKVLTPRTPSLLPKVGIKRKIATPSRVTKVAPIMVKRIVRTPSPSALRKRNRLRNRLRGGQ
jgi:hypothetical protein